MRMLYKCIGIIMKSFRKKMKYLILNSKLRCLVVAQAVVCPESVAVAPQSEEKGNAKEFFFKEAVVMKQKKASRKRIRFFLFAG